MNICLGLFLQRYAVHVFLMYCCCPFHPPGHCAMFIFKFCNFAGNFIPKSAPPHLWTTKPYSTTRVPLQRTSATTIQTTTCLRNRYNHFWLDQASSNTRSNASVYLGSFLWKKIFSSKYKSKYKLHQQWPAEKESTKIPVRLRTN